MEAFTQFKLDREQDTNLLMYLITGDRGQSGFIRATNLPIRNDKVNIFLYGSNSARSYNGIANYNTQDITSLYYDQINLTITTERQINLHWDMIVGINYKYYHENNSKNDRESSLFNSLKRLWSNLRFANG